MLLMRRCLGRLVLIVLGLCGVASCQSGPGIPSDPVCRDCSVALAHVATVGGSGGPSLLPVSNVAVDGRGRFFVAPTYAAGEIAMYDPRGRFVGHFGRTGEGPGEFAGFIHRLVVGPGDSIHVFEGSRHSVVAPGLASFAYVRSLPVQPNYLAFLPNGRILVQQMVVGSGGVGLPFHEINAQGEIERSFGGDGPWDLSKHYTGIRPMRASGDRVWSAGFGNYRLDLWTPDGVHQRTLVRNARWFRPWADRVQRSAEAMEHPRLTSIAEDGEGRLWTAILVPDPDWQERSQPRERRIVDVDLNPEFDTIIEVLDPRTERVVARTRFDAVISEFIGDGSLVYTRREDRDGDQVIDVWRVRLSTSNADGADD